MQGIIKMLSTTAATTSDSVNVSEKKGSLSLASGALKAVNIVFFIAFLSITLREVYQCIEKYVAFPKYTKLGFVSQREVEFPSLTFCANLPKRVKPYALKVY